MKNRITNTLKNRIPVICAMIILLSSLAEAKIVFVGARTSAEGGLTSDLYVMDDDGSNLRKVTNTVQRERHPAWSPDGKRIVFTREITPQNRGQVIILGKQVTNVFIIDADGSNEQRLTNHQALDSYPLFFPDGKYLCYLTNVDGETALHIADVETGKVKQRIKGFIANPDWSPDGQDVVYGDRGDIYIMGSNFRNREPLLPWPLRDKDIPARINIGFFERYLGQYSPDGRKVMYYETAYSTESEPVSSNIFLHDIRLNIQESLPIHKDWRVSGVRWMADGKTIIFSADEVGIKNRRHGNYNIYRYHIPSNTTTQLTYLPGRNTRPSWIEGALEVTLKDKKITRWAEVKVRK